MHDVFRATIVAKITYCAPAWSGFCSAADRLRLDSFLSRCKRFGFTDNTLPLVEFLFSDADDTFFHRVLINSHHVLQLVLPQQHETQYNLRTRQHDSCLLYTSPSPRD